MTKNQFNKLKLPLIAVAGAGLLYAFMPKEPSPFQNLAVKNFQVDKYLGQWFEIARFDFKYEKDLKNVTANYSLSDNGKIKVTNKGFNYIKNKWQEAHAKAKQVKESNVGAIKVSFFGPFYSEYNIVMLEEDYSSALIFGQNTNYIWILSRTKSISEETKKKYLDFAQQNGYDINRFVWTEQDKEY